MDAIGIAYIALVAALLLWFLFHQPPPNQPLAVC